MSNTIASLTDILWRNVARVLPSGLDHIVEGNNFHEGGILDVDVCIVTNCSFPGGNASSTLEELRAFRQAGLTVVIVHCPVRGSPWKRWRIAERFAPELEHIVPAHRVANLRCRTLIVRGPRMAMTDNFHRLAPRLRPDKAIFVINNSAWNENGKVIFDWDALLDRVAELAWPGSELCPLGPIVRDEVQRTVRAERYTQEISERDWPPAFDPDAFAFKPRPKLSEPLVIGRHGRDHEAKWIEDPKHLLAVYPEDGSVTVRIMGGADTAGAILGHEPVGWEVLPFGSHGVEDYLAGLDVFVYFPSSARYEAFGRTIIEALLAGLPVVLPPRFAATFGDLAFYCEPMSVPDLLSRLAADDTARLSYLSAARTLAIELFGSPSLVTRLRVGSDVQEPCLDAKQQAYRHWIQTGERRDLSG